MRIKDIAQTLTEVALDTGYEPEFLYERFDEEVRDGDTWAQALAYVTGVSMERDW